MVTEKQRLGSLVCLRNYFSIIQKMFINKDLVSGIEVLLFLRANGEVGFDACPVVGTAGWPDGKGHGERKELASTLHAERETLPPLVSPVPGCPGATRVPPM